MENAKFILKEPSCNKDTLIFFIARFNYKRFKYSIEQKINPNYWDFETRRAIETNSHPKIKERGVRLTKEIIKNNSTINKGVISDYNTHYKNVVDYI